MIPFTLSLSKGRKAQLVLVSVCLLITASACCIGPDYYGVEFLRLEDDGRIVSGSWPAFASRDGGVTWSRISDDALSSEYRASGGARMAGTRFYDDALWPEFLFSGEVAETPRGTYEIDGTEVYRVLYGDRQRVYSTAYLTEGSNLWAHGQVVDTPKCGAGLTTKPTGILYDPGSGNLVLGMGWLGVALGQPDESWVEVGVGPYTPIDLSFNSKLPMMFETGRWVQNFGAALLIAFTAVALANCMPRRSRKLLEAAAIGAGLVVIVGFAFALAIIVLISALFGSLTVILIALMVAAILVLPAIVLFRQRMIVSGFAMAYCAVVLLGSLLLVSPDIFGGTLFGS